MVGDTEHDIACAAPPALTWWRWRPGSATARLLAAHAPDLLLDDLAGPRRLAFAREVARADCCGARARASLLAGAGGFGAGGPPMRTSAWSRLVASGASGTPRAAPPRAVEHAVIAAPEEGEVVQAVAHCRHHEAGALESRDDAAPSVPGSGA